jgi:hypothetical protein
MAFHADMNLARIEHLGPAQRQRQHDGVARRDIGDRMLLVGVVGTAMARSVSAEPPMLARSTRITRCSRAPRDARHRRRGRELHLVALPVRHRQGITLQALLA